MRLTRSSGILCHPSSLPGRFGIGDIGPSSESFLEFLDETGQRWWQMLPVGPTGGGNSPYQSYSSFAGNPALISPELLVAEGWLDRAELDDYPVLPDDRVEFETVARHKTRLLELAFRRFNPGEASFNDFVWSNASWLDDYALFMAIKRAYDGRAWSDWPWELRRRDAAAIGAARAEYSESIQYYQFEQYLFARQFNALRSKCHARSIGLIGDVPIFVDLDSADVWSRPDLFYLDEAGRPTVVAGVPPDYFSVTGQLWGNPLYRWDVHAEDGFSWWIARMRAATLRFDLVRLDHFRGFEGYWEIPVGSLTAETGRWAKGPGIAFLEALRSGLGSLPLIAEDLGDITAEVLALRDRFDLPGMRVFQFGFDSDPRTSPHLPHNYVNHCVAFSGTHDNDTSLGWYLTSGIIGDPTTLSPRQRFLLDYLRSEGRDLHWDIIRSVEASVADTVIIPLQDILGISHEGRMNVPGKPDGNWSWRMRPGVLDDECRHRLSTYTAVFGRWNGEPPSPYRYPQIATK